MLAASGDSTAPSAIVEAGGTEVATITEAAGDVVTGDVSDTFDIVAAGGTYTAVTAVTVLTDGAIDTTTYAKTGLDVFVYKDGANFYLAYETTAGSAGNFGALETVQLVGIVDANDTFAVSSAGVVSFVAIAQSQALTKSVQARLIKRRNRPCRNAGAVFYGRLLFTTIFK